MVRWYEAPVPQVEGLPNICFATYLVSLYLDDQREGYPPVLREYHYGRMVPCRLIGYGLTERQAHYSGRSYLFGLDLLNSLPLRGYPQVDETRMKRSDMMLL